MGGADKALLSLAGVPLISHVVNRFGPQVASMAINANGDRERFAATGLPVLADHWPDHPGPLAGIAAGLAWAKGQGYDGLATVAVDTPFFPGDMVVRLHREIGTCGVAVPASAGQVHPTCALWRVASLPAVEAALLGGRRRVIDCAGLVGMVAVEFAERPDPFFNINRPEDLALAAARIAP